MDVWIIQFLNSFQILNIPLSPKFWLFCWHETAFGRFWRMSGLSNSQLIPNLECSSKQKERNRCSSNVRKCAIRRCWLSNFCGVLHRNWTMLATNASNFCGLLFTEIGHCPLLGYLLNFDCFVDTRQHLVGFEGCLDYPINFATHSKSWEYSLIS